VLGLPFHHIGIACADIEATASFVRKAFHVASDSGTIHDPIQNADLRIFNEGRPGAIELVSGPMVEKVVRKMSYYHVCYTTPDIERTIADAKAVGAMQAGPVVPAVLFGGRRIVFMYTDIGLVEFLEESTD
jgi:catechol 2,3-dioxygenase-like lactoylglutathione lyase family enzyme